MCPAPVLWPFSEEECTPASQDALEKCACLHALGLNAARVCSKQQGRGAMGRHLRMAGAPRGQKTIVFEQQIAACNQVAPNT